MNHHWLVPFMNMNHHWLVPFMNSLYPVWKLFKGENFYLLGHFELKEDIFIFFTRKGAFPLWTIIGLFPSWTWTIVGLFPSWTIYIVWKLFKGGNFYLLGHFELKEDIFLFFTRKGAFPLWTILGLFPSWTWTIVGLFPSWTLYIQCENYSKVVTFIN